MTCRGPRGPLPDAPLANVIEIRCVASRAVPERLDPIEALTHICTIVAVLEEGGHGPVVAENLREIRAILARALPSQARRRSYRSDSVRLTPSDR